MENEKDSEISKYRWTSKPANTSKYNSIATEVTKMFIITISTRKSKLIYFRDHSNGQGDDCFPLQTNRQRVYRQIFTVH